MNPLRHFRRSPPCPTTPDEVEAARKRTLSLSVAEGSCWSVMAGFGDIYVSPFAVFLGASNRAMALLGTMSGLIGALAQIAGASAADRLGRRRALIVPTVALQALAFLPLFLVPFLWRSLAVPAVLLTAALGACVNNAAAPAWTSLMGDVVPEATRGDYFGRRGRIVILILFAATLLAGRILHAFEESGRVWAGFGVLFGVACVARLFSARLLALHYDPPYRPPREAFFTFWAFIRAMPRSNFARFSMYVALMLGACNVAAPFFNVYMLRDLDWSYAQFTGSQAVFLISQFVFIRWWGRIGDRYGNRVIITVTGFMLPAMPLLWTFSTNYVYLLGVQLFAGAGWSGFSLACQNFTLDAVTSPKRARIASYVSLLNGLVSLLGGTLIGANLADSLPSAYSLGAWRVTFLSSLPGVFAVSAVLRLAATVFMLPHFKEVRKVEPIHPAALMLRLAGGQALAEFVSEAFLRLARPRRPRGGMDDG